MMIDTDDYRPICPKHLPYLNINALAGRSIPIHTFHDGNRWHLWLQTENGFLQPLRVEDCIETVYLALKTAHISDAYFKFFNFIYKYVDNRTSLSFINALASDIFNIGTSLKKLDLFRSLGKDLGGRSRIVSTELEYLLVVCRSVFDLLQEIICRIWEDVITDPSIQKRKLTPSFSKMVLSGQDVISSQKIQEKYGLPPSLAIWYSECAPFFCELRDARDKIVHQPSDVPLIYIMDDSFSIGVDSVSSLFSKMIDGRLG